MDENDDAPKPSTQQMFSIGDIFKNIQQKIKDTKTQKTDEAMPAQASEPSEILDATSPISEPSNSSLVKPVSSSEPDDDRSCSETPVVLAPVSEPEERNGNATSETSVSGLPAWGRDSTATVEIPLAVAVSDVCAGEHDQAKSPTGTSHLATPDSAALQEQQNDIVHIKQEKEDAGYDVHHHGGNSRCDADVMSERVTIKIEEPFMPVVKMEKGDDPEMGNDPDVVFHGVSYRVPDDSDSESEGEISLTSFGKEPEPEEVDVVVPRTKGEILPEELPPLENLHISLPQETKLEPLGVVTGIVGVLVVIESTADLEMYSPLNDETVLFFENKQPFGVVFEVFGPCKAPSYSVRFNSVKDIQEKGIEAGLTIYFVPEPVPEVGEITHYVFVQKLKRIKGSDASWKGNNEPPDGLVEFSDDEEEKRHKSKRKSNRNPKGTVEPNHREYNEERSKQSGSAKRQCSAHEGAPSSSANRRADSSGPARYTHTNDDSQRRPPSSHSSGNRHFSHRNDFRLSKPVFTAPDNPTSRPPHHWNPPPPHSSASSQPFPPRGGDFENRWMRGPFPDSPMNRPFNVDQDRPPFPDGPGSGLSFGAPRRPPFSASPGGGPFDGGPGRRFPDDSPGLFAGERGHPSGAQGFRSPPNSASAFSVDMSLPPPRFPPFSAGQRNSHQGHPPPPWSPPPPSFGVGYGNEPPMPSHSSDRGSGGVQPYGFGSDPGEMVPQQRSFDSGRRSPAQFQGQPRFVQYHQHQSQNWQP